MTSITQSEAEAVLFREALLLDRREFKAWLDLYEDDALYWMPAWKSETTQTEDPDAELSLIYYRGRSNLVDRVQRLTSGQSPASRVAPRVVHVLSNVLIESDDGQVAEVSSCFANHVYDPRTDRTSIFFGHYEHGLRRVAGEWRIAKKIIRLANDVIPTVLDVDAA